MRRMYSEQELTKVIKEVFEAELADGALDEQVSDAVDAYLVENPVDITALEGQDISCNSVDADATITGAEIVEKMSGYSFTPETTELTPAGITLVFAGVVKNGNKITFAIAGKFAPTADLTIAQGISLGSFTIPSDIGSKLYPLKGSYLGYGSVVLAHNSASIMNKQFGVYKGSNTSIRINLYNANTDYVNGNEYAFRIEVTFLLSENLIS